MMKHLPAECLAKNVLLQKEFHPKFLSFTGILKHCGTCAHGKTGKSTD